MNDFNLQKFLVENKMTRNSRLLSENIEYIVDNGTEIDQRKFLQHFYNVLKQAGYNVLNPSKTIHSIHLHLSNHRTYKSIDRISEPYHFIFPHH
jgi:hypothetical protein